MTLCCAPTTGGKLANVVEKDGTLQRVELRGIRGDLSQKRIGHEHRCLTGVTARSIAEERRNVDLEGSCETVEGRQRRHSFAIFNLGDIGSGYTHTTRELPLAQVANVAKIAHGGGDLDALLGLSSRGDKNECCRRRSRLIDLETGLAAFAVGGGCAELHQAAAVAT